MTRSEILKLDDNTLDQKVRIQGTRFDRKRKYTTQQYNKMKNLYAKGKTIYEIAAEMNVPSATVRYNVDADFRGRYNRNRDGKHTGVDVCTKENRIAYKRSIIDSRKMRSFA